MVGIYKITSPTNKIYIGQSWDIKNRWKGYKYTKQNKSINKLQSSFIKYGLKNHIFEIIHELPYDITQNILDNYDFSKNDMENFSIIKNKTGLIKTLPIFPKINTTNEEINFVSENFKDFNLIFDAAAMGQYLGGIDPKNDSSNTIGLSIKSFSLFLI